MKDSQVGVKQCTINQSTDRTSLIENSGEITTHGFGNETEKLQYRTLFLVEILPIRRKTLFN